jgi:biofilm PGA synthesis protein PgaD
MRASLVIHRPEVQTRGQRYSYAAITLIFWFVYLYLWQPLISLVLWALGLGLAHHEMVGEGGYLGLLRLLGVYGLIVLALAVVYLGWALINYYRFRGVERRNAQTIVSLQESAEFFGVEPEELSAWREHRSMVLYHDEHGNLTTVKTAPDYLAPQSTSGVAGRLSRPGSSACSWASTGGRHRLGTSSRNPSVTTGCRIPTPDVPLGSVKRS